MLAVAFTNQKGGVGKTTTVAGIADALDRRGLRVLCVDLDPQADLSTWLGLDPLDTHQLNVNDVIHSGARGSAAQAIQRAAWGEHLSCIGSTLDLADRENDAGAGAEFRLSKALAGVEGFDVVLIDCPPSIGRLVVLGFVAATHAVIVTEPSAASLRGVANVLNTVDVVHDHYNQELSLAGIIVNRQGRTKESALRMVEIVDAYGSTVWQPYIPSRALVAEAMGARASVAEYGADARAVLEVYDALAEHVVALGKVTR